MATTIGIHDAAQVSPPDRPRSSRTRVTFEVLIAAVGLGTTVLVGLDGSWPWCVVRILLVGVVTSRAIAVVHHGSRRPSAMVAVALGLVATPVGGGVALPFFTATGVSLRAVAGALTATAGFALLVLGTVVLAHSIRGWKAVLTIPVVLALCYTVGSPVALSVAATNVPRQSLGNETPSDRGLAYVDAAFVTSDNVRLSGWYIPTTNGAAVAMVPGASSTRSNVLDEATVLAHHGYGVLLFDPRGMGRSGGRAMNFGWYGDRDIEAAVDFLVARADVNPDRIGVLGLSMGGEEAIGAIASDTRIRAVVAEGATNRVAADWAWLPDAYGPRGRVQQAINRLTYALTDRFTSASPPSSLRAAAAKAAPRRILLITAGNVTDEFRAGEYIRQATPGSVELWVAVGADHAAALAAQPAAWEERVTTFLAAAFDAA
jgi:pimeloyl-ACP methyl ester carboxylesterase